LKKNKVSFKEEVSLKTEILPFRMMGYQTFITSLSKETALSIHMLHEVFCTLLKTKTLDINPYMSLPTIREIKKGFNAYLMQHVFGKFKVSYKQTSNSVHPTKLTDANGEALSSIDSAAVGIFNHEDTPPENYLFNEIFYDDPGLELENIKTQIQEVIVYTKIPRSSIRIPLVGGGTYSPDFAYVIKDIEGNTELNLVVESKNKTEGSLALDESQRIKHAEAFFNQIDKSIKVSFKKQFQSKRIVDLIKETLQSSSL
jgi:type III restriction enzyme